jgi:hypothetical protein
MSPRSLKSGACFPTIIYRNAPRSASRKAARRPHTSPAPQHLRDVACGPALATHEVARPSAQPSHLVTAIPRAAAAAAGVVRQQQQACRLLGPLLEELDVVGLLIVAVLPRAPEQPGGGKLEPQLDLALDRAARVLARQAASRPESPEARRSTKGAEQV